MQGLSRVRSTIIELSVIPAQVFGSVLPMPGAMPGAMPGKRTGTNLLATDQECHRLISCHNCGQIVMNAGPGLVSMSPTAGTFRRPL